jgi:hypothetical protein
MFWRQNLNVRNICRYQPVRLVEYVVIPLSSLKLILLGLFSDLITSRRDTKYLVTRLLGFSNQ